jgi:hypothetical protein
MTDGDSTEEQDGVHVRPATAPPAADEPDTGQDGRQMAWLIGAGLALIAAIAVTIATLWPDSDDSSSAAAPPGVTWPAWTGSPEPPASAASPSAPARSGPSPSTSSSPSPSSTRPSPPPARPSPPPSATLAPPPAADRVGPIVGPGGDCLDVAAGVVLPGDAVVVRDCNGTLSQRWTVAADGTLRVSGSCAGAGGSGQVTVGTCGTATSGQWRSGAGGSLVNVGSGQCLTASAEDNRARVAACGAARQRWALP